VAAISVFVKEIDVTWKQLRSLRNALAPISFLPPEVLAQVFHFLWLEDPPRFEEHYLGWIRATHVCRLWRRVALGDSLLWTRIADTLNNTGWVSEMLTRARNAPLNIDIKHDLKRGPKWFFMFSPHLSRTRKLRIKFLHSTQLLWQLDNVRSFCSQEAPALEHFELRGLKAPLTISLELGGTTLFRGQAPRLRTLSLYDAFIPWSLIPRGQLTQLEIVLVYDESKYSDPPHGDLNQLIDLLVNCPELEVLALGNCLPSRLTQFPHGQIIPLPCLSRLRLVGSSSRMTSLFNMLKVPSSITLHLRCTFENSSHDDHRLLSAVSTHFRSPSPVEFKKLSVTTVGLFLELNASTSFSTSRINQSQEFESHTDDNDNKFVLRFVHLPNHDIIKRVFEILPISNLEFLSISSLDAATASVNWVEVLKRCTKVSAMQIIGIGTCSLVRGITTTSTPAHMHAPIFPNLTSLTLKKLDFTEIEQPSRALFDVLQKGLRQRMVAFLCIEECSISAKRAKALKKLVQKFHWDEEAKFDNYDSGSDEPAS
jgi:hypothetical protein